MELVERHGIEQASLSETGPCVLLMAKPTPGRASLCVTTSG